MTGKSVDLASEFIQDVGALEVTRHKMESLLSNGHINETDIVQFYNGLYLNLFVEFERLLDELFFGLLSGDISTSLPVVRIVPPISSDLARSILLIGKNYLDWLPYENTLERAKVFFQDGMPFTLLNDQNRSNLSRYVYIRNAIAHRSDYAVSQFIKHIIGDSKLPPRERTPVGFLRGNFRSAPSQTRYELVVQELKSISLIICG